MVEYIPEKNSVRRKIVCVCICGTRCVISTWKNVKSCGCYLRDNPSGFKHGGATTSKRTREYRAWKGMKARCHNPNIHQWRDYGGRGIKVCERWLEKDGFKNFLNDVGYAPSEHHSIDRFPDVNGNYEPGNVRWATRTEQARNMRSNHNITLGGKTYCIAEWADIYKIDENVIRTRMRDGWNAESAITTPSRICMSERIRLVEKLTPMIIIMVRLGFHRRWVADWYDISERTVRNVIARAS